MIEFNKVNLDQEKLIKLKKNQWDLPSFLSLLSRRELISTLGVEKSEANLQQLDNALAKIKLENSLKLIYRKKATQNSWSLSTGSLNIDSILDFGGLNAGDLTMLYGPFRSGKSQFAHQCTVIAFKKFQQNLPKKIALFVDTEGTFRPERIEQMAIKNEISPNEILKQIDVISLQNLSEFSRVFPKIPEIIRMKGIKILMIDSLTKLYRYEIAQNIKPINSIIADLASKLRRLQQWAQQYNIPILITSQVTAAIDDAHFFKVIPILATTLNMYVKQWILLGEGEQGTDLSNTSGIRYAHLLNSQIKKEQIVKFQITTTGIEDVF